MKSKPLKNELTVKTELDRGVQLPQNQRPPNAFLATSVLSLRNPEQAARSQGSVFQKDRSTNSRGQTEHREKLGGVGTGERVSQGNGEADPWGHQTSRRQEVGGGN